MARLAARPDGRGRRRSFWWGVMVAVAVIGGLWFAFSVYINWKFGGRYGVNGTYLKCDKPL